jgi:hypothetical protein
MIHITPVKSQQELHMSLRGAPGFAEAVSYTTGDCFVGKNKYPPRKDMVRFVEIRKLFLHNYLLDDLFRL